jgi:hypothetical protein
MNHLHPIDPIAMKLARLPAPIVLIIGLVMFFVDGMVLSRVLEGNITGGALTCNASYRLRLMREPRPMRHLRFPRPAGK